MKVTPEDQKVLRRVCNQYRTGIRKNFGVSGRTFTIVLDTFTSPPQVLLRFDDVQYMYNCEHLDEVTPESILTAIDIFEVRQVMES